MTSYIQKNRVLKFFCLMFVAIAFFVITDIMDTTPYLSINNNKVLASAVDIPMPTPAEIDAGKVWDEFIKLLKGLIPVFLGMMFAIAAIMFITSAGNPEKIGIAWKAIIFGLVGSLVVLFADWVVGLFR